MSLLSTFPRALLKQIGMYNYPQIKLIHSGTASTFVYDVHLRGNELKLHVPRYSMLHTYFHREFTCVKFIFQEFETLL